MQSHRFRVVVAALVVACFLGLASVADARTFVIPHFTDSLSAPANTFDTLFKFVYTAGLAGIPMTIPGAQVDLYLFNDGNGATVKGFTGAPICNPCTFSLSPSNRVVRTTLETLANNNAGGLKGSGSRRLTGGYAIIVVVGADVETVAVQAFTINTHTNGFDVSMEDLPVREVPGP
jgi:hypothetical protein